MIISTTWRPARSAPELYSYHVEGRDRDVAWGFYLGAAAMTVQALVLAVAGWRTRR